ncbi:hypothetical protein ACRAWD_02220 [Caulobacter segnis]
MVDELERYQGVTDLAPGVEIFPRSELMRVQEMLRDTPGVTVLLYDQTCATEKRRRRKRGAPCPRRPGASSSTRWSARAAATAR